jgi:hypothetical protein
MAELSALLYIRAANKKRPELQITRNLETANAEQLPICEIGLKKGTISSSKAP